MLRRIQCQEDNCTRAPEFICKCSNSIFCGYHYAFHRDIQANHSRLLISNIQKELEPKIVELKQEIDITLKSVLEQATKMMSLIITTVEEVTFELSKASRELENNLELILASLTESDKLKSIESKCAILKKIDILAIVNLRKRTEGNNLRFCELEGQEERSVGLYFGHKIIIGISKWPNGNTYEGDFVDGKRTGKGIFKFAIGDTYEGDFVEGNRTGRGFTSGLITILMKVSL